ncbi:MAG: hypothetical protein AB8H79_07500 [Myxococcota bacterium]
MLSFLWVLAGLSSNALAQTDASWTDTDTHTALNEMAPLRIKLRETISQGEWRAGPARVSIQRGPHGTSPAYCLEDLLKPAVGAAANGATLSVKRGTPLHNRPLHDDSVEDRYLRTHYRSTESALVVWEGAEYQIPGRSLGYQWHDGVRTGRDMLILRDAAGRTQSIYSEASHSAEQCYCLMGTSPDLVCTAFSEADVQDGDLKHAPSYRLWAQFRWSGDQLTGAVLTRVSTVNTVISTQKLNACPPANTADADAAAQSPTPAYCSATIEPQAEPQRYVKVQYTAATTAEVTFSPPLLLANECTAPDAVGLSSLAIQSESISHFDNDFR